MAEMQWRPIEEAPRDGTRVLAFARGEYGDTYWGVAEWVNPDPDMNPHIPAKKLPMWWWSYAIRPTHWQPLPSPPAGETEHE